MITLHICPVCKSRSIAQFPTSGIEPRITYEIMPGTDFPAAIVIKYSLCQACGVVFQNPRMADFEVNKYYEGGYYRRSIEGGDEDIARAELERAVTDANIVSQVIGIGSVSSHLDIGCGHGFFLDKVGALVKVGVEPEALYAGVNNVEVYSRMSQVPRKSFELVTATHVLEHVPDPHKFLFDMKRFICKDGYILIEVPTWSSPGGPLRLAHLFHFEPNVLKALCVRAGLIVISEYFTPHLVLICKVATK